MVPSRCRTGTAFLQPGPGPAGSPAVPVSWPSRAFVREAADLPRCRSLECCGAETELGVTALESGCLSVRGLPVAPICPLSIEGTAEPPLIVGEGWVSGW